MLVNNNSSNGVSNSNGGSSTSSTSLSSSPPPPQELLERLKDYGQEDVFALWDELSPHHRQLLVNHIQSLDLSRIDRIIRCSFRSQGVPAAVIEPVPEGSVSTVEQRTLEQREKWWKTGMKAIYEGKLGVLLLSGGQGTRLGSSDPKGCFNIGLPSGKTLFQLQAERILCIRKYETKYVFGTMRSGLTKAIDTTHPCITSLLVKERRS